MSQDSKGVEFIQELVTVSRWRCTFGTVWKIVFLRHSLYKCSSTLYTVWSQAIQTCCPLLFRLIRGFFSTDFAQASVTEIHWRVTKFSYLDMPLVTIFGSVWRGKYKLFILYFHAAKMQGLCDGVRYMLLLTQLMKFWNQNLQACVWMACSALIWFQQSDFGGQTTTFWQEERMQLIQTHPKRSNHSVLFKLWLCQSFEVHRHEESFLFSLLKIRCYFLSFGASVHVLSESAGEIQLSAPPQTHANIMYFSRLCFWLLEFKTLA